ncbi:MAG: NADP-dependent malic enzyme, partial [Magnetococcales bacterium]|nr:NADP-dependent malic enzyme [Magnetococcales bacterium]
MADDNLYESALQYHRGVPAGKLTITPTKPLTTQRDLALAYSPGVAAACHAITNNPNEATNLTTRANLVAVISNGTAVLGLGNIGPLASKPVMEGKAVLFKKFAGINVFDLEVAETDPDRFVEIVASLEPTFGGINLEDIKAPECFEIEAKLRKRMKIPVFHDDQHGTAIVVAAAVLSGLKVVEKRMDSILLVVSGAGAAATACLNLLLEMGLPKENIVVADRQGVIRRDRPGLTPQKAVFATGRNLHTLAEAIADADVFLGLSGPGILTREMVVKMAPNPLVLALANPTPEILPEVVKAVRPDAVMATGRSDYPNQVNNVLCFPFLFRGALDVGATEINQAMKQACVQALADLATTTVPDVVAFAYAGEKLVFGPDYFIVKPFDPRLIVVLASAVAKAAMESGVATRPIADLTLYRQQLFEFVSHSGLVMRPIFERARRNPKRVALAHAEEERVLRAAQQMIDDQIGRPVLVGSAPVIQEKLVTLGLEMRPGENVDLIDPATDPRYEHLCTEYHLLMERNGCTPDNARQLVRESSTIVAALLVRRGEADAMLCGAVGLISAHIRVVRDVIGRSEGIRYFSALSGIILDKGVFFICDTNVIADPTAEQVTDMTIRAARQVARFGMTPKVALLSSSSFGSYRAPSTLKMRQALEMIRQQAPDLEVEGEMRADAALSEEIRRAIFPNSRLKGQANLLIMPNL